MEATTRQLWTQQNQHEGDRQRLFAAVAASIDVSTVLYPGSYVDLAPSLVWPSVTYVDIDKRANRFFGDAEGVRELLSEHDVDPAEREIRFIHADYTDELDIADASVDLLVSLYAGLVTDHCTRYVRPGGYVLVNPSHGDAALANLNPSLDLRGVVISSGGRYRVRTDALDSYFEPKRPDVSITEETIRASGRAIAYTKSAFAYLFERRA